MSISMTDAVMATYPGQGVGAPPMTAAAGSVAAATSAPDADATKRAAIDKTAKSFEASFLSTMIGQMFEGVETAKPFGGGEGENAFRSFLTEAMGKSMTKHGGIGLSKAISQEMLKMQGLS